MFKHIDAKWFFLSLAIGLFIVYCSTPTPEVIIKYPTPDNAHELIFEDDSDNCYKFKTEEVNCPSKNEINQIPIQRKNM